MADRYLLIHSGGVIYTFEGGADAARLVLSQYDPAADSFRGEKAGLLWDAVRLAHNMGRYGKGRRIAVIDTGFDISIPCLSSQSLAWPTPANARTAHGSAVALLIHEVAPMAHLDLYPVSDDNGFNTELALKAISDAIEAGTDVVNMSFGEDLPFDDVYNKELSLPSEQDPVVAIAEDRLANPDWRRRLRIRTLNPLEAATAVAVGNGCSVIASAGNRYEGIFSPALVSGVVSVGFIKILSAFSGGVELKQAGFAGFYQQNYFMDLGLLQPPGTIGSSFATPLVSGFVATMPEPALMPSYITAGGLAGTADTFTSGGTPLSQQITEAMDRLYRAAIDAIPHKHWSEPLERRCRCNLSEHDSQSRGYDNQGTCVTNRFIRPPRLNEMTPRSSAGARWSTVFLALETARYPTRAWSPRKTRDLAATEQRPEAIASGSLFPFGEADCRARSAMPNLNPQDARTDNPAPTLWKYDPQANILWLKLTDASSNTSWLPVQLNQYPRSVDHTGAA